MLPSEESLGPFDRGRERHDDAVSSVVRPALDIAAEVFETTARNAWRLTSPARPLVMSYVDALGLTQTWSMFGNPPQGSEYLRFRYYSTREGHHDGEMTVATELAFPVGLGTQNRIARAYWQGHREKALSNAFGAYFRARTRVLGEGTRWPSSPDPALERALARTFRPVIQFHSKEYARRHLSWGDRLVRTEAWYGWATSRERGSLPLAPRSRAAALDRYYRGVREETVQKPVFQSVDKIESEADLLWVLIYVQTSPQPSR